MARVRPGKLLIRIVPLKDRGVYLANFTRAILFIANATKKKHPPFEVKYVSFDFLGFTFKPRIVKGYFGRFHLSFTPAISRTSQRQINQTLCKLKLHRMVHLRLPDLTRIIADKVRGWIYYYGKVRMSELHYVFRFLNLRLAKWVRNKYRRFRRKHWFFAYKWLQETARQFPNMFVHWKYGFMP